MARKLSRQFHHDWNTMILALAAAGLALYIGLAASSSKTNPPQVAGESTTIGY